jgi:hypothetical protein
MELREAAIYTHLARYYTMLQDPEMRAFRAYCKANPNAIDHRKVKAEKAKAQVETAKKVKSPSAKAAT